MSKKVSQKKVKVLYQNLNGVWYAFADIDDSIYFGAVPLQATAPKDEKSVKRVSAANASTKRRHRPASKRAVSKSA